MKRDLITISELSPKEIEHIFVLASKLKKSKLSSNLLKGKSVGLIFQKPSNRTRVSFEVGVYQLGGNCIYLGPTEINLGQRESTHDVAKTLSRYLDCIVARTFHHQDVVDLGKHASIPIINGLSDLDHPCQGLTDLFSIKEKFWKLKGLTLAYIGDGNNVCHSLMIAAVKMGMNMHVATPKGYEPNEEITKQTLRIAKENNSKVLITQDPIKAIKNTNIIYSDVFISMGEESQSTQKSKHFKGFQINNTLVKYADKNFIYMHCLPAHRGEEVTAEIIDGKHSIVFDQAENRLHVQKAILTFLLGKKGN